MACVIISKSPSPSISVIAGISTGLTYKLYIEAVDGGLYMEYCSGVTNVNCNPLMLSEVFL